jgi:multidrug efflux system membrane fusion protein
MSVPNQTGTPPGPLQRAEQPTHSRESLRRWWVWLLLLCLLAAGAYIFLINPGKTQQLAAKQGPTAAARSVPVVAVPAKTGDIGIYLTGLGSVTPLNTVTVKSRIDGQLMKVLFREGQMVKQGDLLAEIDPRPYQVQLTQAEGQMAHDQALFKNAQVDLKRYRKLFAEDSIAEQQLSTQEALVRQYDGSIKADQGQIDNARLQLLYCRITAPIGGRVGLRQVDPGNMVHASDQNGLVVITQLQPITVVFTIPEDNLPPVLKKLQAGDRLTVEAYDREQKIRLATGYLLTVDNQIDLSTGTIRLKAVFPNDDSSLFPNQFVNVRLLLDVQRGATIVPVSAIQQGTQGAFVYVVQADHTVALRQVKVGPTQGGDVSIDTGITPGELVVVDGVDKLREGSKVELPTKDNDTPGRGTHLRPGATPAAGKNGSAPDRGAQLRPGSTPAAERESNTPGRSPP